MESDYVIRCSNSGMLRSWFHNSPIRDFAVNPKHYSIHWTSFVLLFSDLPVHNTWSTFAYLITLLSLSQTGTASVFTHFWLCLVCLSLSFCHQMIGLSVSVSIANSLCCSCICHCLSLVYSVLSIHFWRQSGSHFLNSLCVWTENTQAQSAFHFVHFVGVSGNCRNDITLSLALSESADESACLRTPCVFQALSGVYVCTSAVMMWYLCHKHWLPWRHDVTSCYACVFVCVPCFWYANACGWVNESDRVWCALLHMCALVLIVVIGYVYICVCVMKCAELPHVMCECVTVCVCPRLRVRVADVPCCIYVYLCWLSW